MIRRVRGETGIRLRMRFQNARLAALGSEPAKLDIHKQCGPGGWPGPHLFLWRRRNLVCPVVSLTIDLRFFFTYTSANGMALDNLLLAAQLDHRKKFVCSSFSEDLTSHSQRVRE
jgi:hypothetical protein